MSKEPVFVSIVCEDAQFNNLSGKYNFHSIKNKAVEYVRDGGKVSLFEPDPYFLSYGDKKWRLKSTENAYWIKLETKGMYY